MRNKHYKARSVRLDDKVWQNFKVKQEKSGLSWNLFVKELLENEQTRKHKD